MSPRLFGILATLAVFMLLLLGAAYSVSCGLTDNCDMTIWFDRI
jgi:hypothetical protein